MIDDEEHYVQKGIGWTLKELHNVYPNETIEFIEKNVKIISAMAFSAATEKFEKVDKERFKNMRKDSR